MDLYYNQLEDYLVNDQIETINKFYKESKNINEFKKVYYWELASLFCTYLNKHHDENRLCDEIGVFCLEASLDLCKNNYGNPREVLLVYLENSSKFQVTDDKFLKFIEILKYILLNIPSKQLLYSLELACGVIYNFINTIELPRDFNLDENDKKVFDHDIRVDRVLELTKTYVSFLDEFVSKKVLNNDDSDSGNVKIRNYILSCLINLFDKPFGLLNVEGVCKSFVDLKIKSIVNIDSSKSDHDLETTTIRTIRYLFQVLLKLNNNLFSLIVNGKNILEEVSNIASSVLAYATYSKHIGLELTKNTSHLPCVYSYRFIFEQVQPFILCLLEQNDHQFLIEKGLKLSYRLFNTIELDAFYIDNKKFIDFINSLFRISIYTQFDSIRRLGGNLLNFIFSRFKKISDRIEFLNYYLNSSLFNKKNDETFNSYVYSFIIYLLKDEIHSFENDDFILRKFEKICFKIFKLDNSVECDLMKNSNKITSTLNLLRFILMRNNFNKMNIINFIINQSNYLKDIEKAVQLSKAHYELEIKNVKNNNDAKLDKNVEFKIESIKNGDEFDTNKELSYEQKLDAMNISLNTIDMIESLRVRCVELIENLK
jgi:hypothetical protein